jgi:hypothetical protein
MEKTTALAVAETMRRLGAGELTVAEAAAAVASAYASALADHDEHRRTDPAGAINPDAASAPEPFVEVAVARQTGVITAEMYAALGQLLVAQRARPSGVTARDRMRIHRA